MDSLDVSFLNKKANRKESRKERHPLYSALDRIKGIKSVSGGGYNLQVIKASMFTWKELLPKILKAVQDTVARNRKMVESAHRLPSLQDLMDDLG